MTISEPQMNLRIYSVLLDLEVFCSIKIQLFMYHCLGIKDTDTKNGFNCLL